MSYTKLPHIPRPIPSAPGDSQTPPASAMKSAALRFLRDSCEGLRFRPDIEAEEQKTGRFQGRSLSACQIPYNMQMDLDRLCLENAAGRFADSGASQDAFDVYFCYLEMFVGEYGASRRMIELLSEFESNGSSLLMKHRDHYSHSVYVFLLGLAIYESNEVYRRAYQEFYSFADAGEAACHFLQFWGLASLFHDIGYPFELPYEQVASYFEVNQGKRSENPFIAYQGMRGYVRLSEDVQKKLKRIYGAAGTDGGSCTEAGGVDAVEGSDALNFESTDDLFAFDIAEKLSGVYPVDREGMKGILASRPVHPESCGNFMDHGYFSATVLFKKLFEELDCELTRAHVDAMTAILLHNSLYKFDVAFYKDKKRNRPFRMELHPLAYMLMLCDELQCWDRTSYGRNSRVELHPMDCRFTFWNNGIQAAYLYDEAEKSKVEHFRREYEKWRMEEPLAASGNPDLLDAELASWKKREPKLKAYASMVFENEFLANIQAIVDLSEVPLTVEAKLEKKDNRKKKAFLSGSSFLNLYHFAVALNGRWGKIGEWQRAKEADREEEFLNENMAVFLDSFKELSLEYKLSNINQAKAFAEYLDAIGCFYTDKPVDYEMLEHFEPEEAVRIGRMEHRRWLLEHIEMGWRYGEKLPGDERERRRVHVDMIPKEKIAEGGLSEEAARENYDRLGKEEQDKDIAPMDAMLTLLKMFEGLRIYRM